MRTMNRLTSNKIKNAKPGPDKRTVLLCDVGGLWLQVGLGKDKQVTKSWIFRYAAAGTKISRTGREYRRERQMGEIADLNQNLSEFERGIEEIARQLDDGSDQSTTQGDDDESND
jgi:hypothetical protein